MTGALVTKKSETSCEPANVPLLAMGGLGLGKRLRMVTTLTDGYYRKGRYYRHKEVAVMYALAGDIAVTVTLIKQ